MRSHQEIATVIKNEELGPNICRLTLNAYNIARSARAGQFVMIKASDGMDPLLRRPFSIHQVMDNGTLQILFKVIGKGTQYLAKLQSGDRVSVVGPLGNSFDVESEGPICLVGGGMGMAPMLFLAKSLLRSPSKKEIIVILGARNSAEINHLLDDFGELGVTVFHSTDDGSSGHKGYIPELLEPAIKNSSQGDWRVVCCGPTVMMKQIAAISKKNNWPCQVSMETMMACGMGACLGCTIKRSGIQSKDESQYLHVCKNGAIFNAEEIVWP